MFIFYLVFGCLVGGFINCDWELVRLRFGRVLRIFKWIRGKWKMNLVMGNDWMIIVVGLENVWIILGYMCRRLFLLIFLFWFKYLVL